VTKHALRGLRLAASTFAVAAMIAATAGPVAADTTPPGDASYSQNGSSVDLYASSCTSDGETTSCTEQGLYAFVGKLTDSVSGVAHTSQLCVSLASYAYSELTGEIVGTPSFEGGCRVDLPAGTLTIDSKLRSATLSPTTVSVEDEACDKFGCEPGAARDIVAEGTWTGFGPLQTSRYRGSYDEGTCRSHEASKGSIRSADVVGSLDGAGLAGDVSGSIFSGKYTFRSSCREV
jgi:hypothetical protein